MAAQKNPTQKKTLAGVVGVVAATLLFALVPKYEGEVLTTYYDPVGIATVCYGDTDPALAIPGKRYTREECLRSLEQKLIAHADPVISCTPDLAGHPNQLAAAVSLAYNIGPSAWLSYEVIAGCEDMEAGLPELYQGGPCFFGNDIARRRDLWVCWVWELIGDVLWTREISELKGASFAAQDAEIARLHEIYRMTRLVMDQTGMGEKPVEDMQRRYGTASVEGVILAGARPLTIATVARQAFEDRRVPTAIASSSP